MPLNRVWFWGFWVSNRVYISLFSIFEWKRKQVWTLAVDQDTNNDTNNFFQKHIKLIRCDVSVKNHIILYLYGLWNKVSCLEEGSEMNDF